MRFLTFTRLQQTGMIVLSCTAILAGGIMICQGTQGKKGTVVKFIPEDIAVGTGSNPALTINTSQRININTASANELMTLPRVGSCTAARIIEYRKRHGGFRRIEELLKVKGIGPKTLARMQKGICLGTATIASDATPIRAHVSSLSAFSTTHNVKNVKTVVSGTASPIAVSSVQQQHLPVNINTASASELETLPGIGPGKAKAILDYRGIHGQFQRIDDITLVKGIGEKILERIRPLITVEVTAQSLSEK